MVAMEPVSSTGKELDSLEKCTRMVKWEWLKITRWSGACFWLLRVEPEGNGSSLATARAGVER